MGLSDLAAAGPTGVRFSGLYRFAHDIVFLVIFLDAAPTRDFLNDFDTFEKLEA